MIVDDGDGRANGTGAYTKAGGGAANGGAVYVVAGSSGQVSDGTFDHPAMFISLMELGSVVVDIDGNRMDVKFVPSNGSVADYFSMVKGPSAPVPPSGLTATAGNGQVALNWTAIPDASRYNVKRATTSGGPYTTIGTPTTATYVNTGLANGTTYNFVVSAVHAAGESANSSQVSATPAGVIRLVIGLDARRRPVLTWNSTPGKTYRVASKARLTDATWTDLSGTISANSSTTTWTDTTSGSTRRWYIVYSVNGS